MARTTTTTIEGHSSEEHSVDVGAAEIHLDLWAPLASGR
jgi:hypothetical protein